MIPSREAIECAIACAPDLATCVQSALENREFVENWNRLNPEHTVRVVTFERRAPIARMIDDACGVPPVAWSTETRDKFIRFVREYLWRPTFDDVLAEAVKRLVPATPSGEAQS